MACRAPRWNCIGGMDHEVLSNARPCSNDLEIRGNRTSHPDQNCCFHGLEKKGSPGERRVDHLCITKSGMCRREATCFIKVVGFLRKYVGLWAGSNASLFEVLFQRSHLSQHPASSLARDTHQTWHFPPYKAIIFFIENSGICLTETSSRVSQQRTGALCVQFDESPEPLFLMVATNSQISIIHSKCCHDLSGYGLLFETHFNCWGGCIANTFS